MELTLREWRKAKKYTQIQMAKRWNRAPITISRMENGDPPTISKDIIMKILIDSDGCVTPNSLYGITESQLAELRKNAQPLKKNRLNEIKDLRADIGSYYIKIEEARKRIRELEAGDGLQRTIIN